MDRRVPDHHSGFITWERYEGIQDQLRANWRPPRGQGGGAAREGGALLQGLIRCGRCGRMMQVGYSGNKGNCPRYVCGRAQQLYGTVKVCQAALIGADSSAGPNKGTQRCAV
jgi:hypothetical protein